MRKMKITGTYKGIISTHDSEEDEYHRCLQGHHFYTWQWGRWISQMPTGHHFYTWQWGTWKLQIPTWASFLHMTVRKMNITDTYKGIISTHDNEEHENYRYLHGHHFYTWQWGTWKLQIPTWASFLHMTMRNIKITDTYMGIISTHDSEEDEYHRYLQGHHFYTWQWGRWKSQIPTWASFLHMTMRNMKITDTYMGIISTHDNEEHENYRYLHGHHFYTWQWGTLKLQIPTWASFLHMTMRNIKITDTYMGIISTHDSEENENHRYRPISNTSRTKSQPLNVSCLLLQLSFPNPFKSGIMLTIGM